MRLGALGALLSTIAILSLVKGDFSKSCTGVYVSLKGVMYAQCETTAQHSTAARIDLNERISNIDGYLRIVRSSGRFTETCDELQILDNHVLTAECMFHNFEYRSTSIDLDAYITNFRGRLNWVASGVRPIPNKISNTTTNVLTENVAAQ